MKGPIEGQTDIWDALAYAEAAQTPDLDPTIYAERLRNKEKEDNERERLRQRWHRANEEEGPA